MYYFLIFNLINQCKHLKSIFMDTKLQHLLAEMERRLMRMEAQQNQVCCNSFDWFDAQKICQKLTISKRTLARYRNAGSLPYSTIGGKLYYRLADVEACLQANLSCKTHQS
jgi:hypothetical protein